MAKSSSISRDDFLSAIKLGGPSTRGKTRREAKRASQAHKVLEQYRIIEKQHNQNLKAVKQASFGSLCLAAAIAPTIYESVKSCSMKEKTACGLNVAAALATGAAGISGCRGLGYAYLNRSHLSDMTGALDDSLRIKLAKTNRRQSVQTNKLVDHFSRMSSTARTEIFEDLFEIAGMLVTHTLMPPGAVA